MDQQMQSDGPATGAYAKLGAEGVEYHVRKMSITIGSGNDCDFKVSAGSSISAKHAVIRYNSQSQWWEIQSIGREGIVVQGVHIASGGPPAPLASKTLVQFPSREQNNRMFYFLLPKGAQAPQLPPDCVAEWTAAERERFQRAFICYGYPRFTECKLMGSLNRRSISDIWKYAKAFVVACHKLSDGKEMKDFLKRLVKAERMDMSIVEPSLEGWKKLERSATLWGRRLRNLHVLQLIVQREISENVDVLHGIPESALHPQKPVRWWTMEDDRILLRATYKHGYARYDAIKTDPEFKFSMELKKSQAPDADQDKKEAALPKTEGANVDNPNATPKSFPPADVLTRRLKRLIEVARKTFIRAKQPDSPPAKKARTSKKSEETAHVWTRDKMRKFVHALGVHGVTKCPFGRVDWSKIIETAKLTERFCKGAERIYTQLMKDMDNLPRTNDPEVWRKVIAHQEARKPSTSPMALCAFRQSSKFSHLVPIKVLRKLKVCLVVLFDLRVRVLGNTNLLQAINEERSKLARPTHADFPSWWKDSDDVALLKGFAKHGIGAWTAMLKDFDLAWSQSFGSQVPQTTKDALMLRFKQLLFVLGPKHRPPWWQEHMNSEDASENERPALSFDLSPERIQHCWDVMCGSERLQDASKRGRNRLLPLSAEEDVDLETWEAIESPRAISAAQAGTRINDMCRLYGIHLGTEPWHSPPKHSLDVIWYGEDGKQLSPMPCTDGLVVHSLGEVKNSLRDNMKEVYLPIGFVSTRFHQSMVFPQFLCEYTNKILKIDGKLVFQVICNDAPSTVIHHKSPDGVWEIIANTIYDISDAPLGERVRSVDGYERFGLKCVSVISRIQTKLIQLSSKEKAFADVERSHQVERWTLLGSSFDPLEPIAL